MRDPANAIIHLAGSILSLIALGVLIWLGARTGNPLALVGLTVYGVSQLALYLASTLHHALRISRRGMEALLMLDCMLVFVYIAGTYTPVCLIALNAGWRWGILSLVWGLTAGGLLMKLLWLHGPAWISTTMYVLMGWVALIALPPLVQALPGLALAWFVAGGIIYTVGAVIFYFDRPCPIPGVFEAHAVWHLCVLAGSACCFVAIVRYVVPMA